MVMRVETNPLEAAYAVLLEHGLDGAGEALRILVNEAAKIERVEFLGARPYERTAARRDWANGYKPKTVLTKLGELTFEVPQVRSGDFYPSALEKGTRTDQAVNLALAEMYVQGVSTRRVIDVLQRLLGPEIKLSSAQVSRAAARLDEGLKAWRERPLGEVPYLFLDARYEKVRLEGRIVDCAVLIAVGIEATGKRRVLGCEVATSEAEINWRRFLESLLARGLKGVKLIVADDHAGLKAARRAVLPSVPWQRCQFHLQQNAGQFVTRQEAKKTVARQLRTIFNAPDRSEAQRLLREALAQWRTEHPKLGEWAEEAIPESLTVFDFPVEHRVRLRTTNGLERINRELRRRTRVASIFPNPESCLRLISALLAELDDEWMTGKVYLNPNP
ncbi:IS256 family transposase [Methylacidimicrobium sp. B4]|uniref:IS256 family transposase n=1 Tax=Methylacidimicrobium sp. B4 TaxID=2796139 RepID=UPI001A8FBB15|nr:IS256 family transposase [Methylacidimicrobium sp. B4]QSR83968.1 IS256 family transposase [Methylacidimicrobium sp. B4]QSR84083.1 IS256 family transposase [Methylacidimicrobium sp. B4]QSR84644.1 IS256 family transposase [Methylacidimicrobium sp. B4]